MKALKWILALSIVTLAGTLLLAEPEFIGAGKCKFCHKVEYASWNETAHAKAFEKLKPEEQTKEECLVCHATGSSADLPGVQCEACHGAGSEYKGMKTMKDRELAVSKGLAPAPGEDLCMTCHGEAPHEQPVFDYETYKLTGLHDMKEKE
jgi:hypothetical protein